MEINPVKGTHDIIGDEADLYFKLEMAARMVADVFGYKEIRTPIIEHSPLFVRSVGESSDIVTKEMYTFLDKGNREITLRPEMTAGVMRSIVSNKLYATSDLPLKFYYFGPCFRYERPQAGRYRQFHQFGIEQVGVKNEYEDAEVVLLGKRFLETIGLGDVKVMINTLGDQQSRDNYRVALKEYFAKHIDNMCDDCKRRLEINPLRILDCKVPEDQELIKNAPKMKDYLSVEAKIYFDKVINILESVGVKVEQDDTLVRGLDYYTGIVFEYHDLNDEVGALGGGGHYKNLLKEIGGPDLEGVGLSFGEERLYYVVKKLLGDENSSTGLDYYLMGMNEQAIESNFILKDMLRSFGLVTDGNNETKSFKALFKIAARRRAKFAIIVGDDELKDKKLTIKNLKSQEQTTISLEDADRVLPSMIEEYNNNEGE